MLRLQHLTSLRLIPWLQNSTQAPQAIPFAACYARWDQGMATGELALPVDGVHAMLQWGTRSVELGSCVMQLLKGLVPQKALAGCRAGCAPSSQVLGDTPYHNLMSWLSLTYLDHYAESLGGARGQQDEEELSLDSKL